MTQQVSAYVSVRGEDILAGQLYSHRRRGAESASFVYDDGYLARPDSYRLDPALPMLRGTLQTPAGQALFGGFADSSPDRWGRTLITRAERLRARQAGEAPRSLGEVDLLLGVRDDLRQGSIRFKRDGQGPFVATDETGVPQLTDLPALLDLAAMAESDAAGYEELKRLVRAGSSLGGARPKVHVRDAAGRTAIAKFPSANSDTWNVMAWEKTALDLAQAAGVDVTDSQLLSIGGRSVLVVDRFDRDADGERIGFASAMTMLEARDGDTRSYLDIAEVIEERSSSTTTDLRQLWRRMAFMVLISNTDDHLRNHGFLHDRGESWRLSPAFDLNPDPEPGATYLSTAIDESDTRASVELLMSVADYFRLDRDGAVAVLREVVGVTSRWRDVASHNGLNPAEVDMMVPAFEHTEAQEARGLVDAQ